VPLTNVHMGGVLGGVDGGSKRPTAGLKTLRYTVRTVR
jgi:hypothetical protein